MQTTTRRLADVAGVGPGMLENFRRLGIAGVAQLSRCEDIELFERLCSLRGQRIDPCCLDLFSVAIAHARHPDLAPAKRRWWYWSGVRKTRAKPKQ